MGMVWAIIIILCVAADQLSKAVVESSLQAAGSIAVIDGFFYISRTVNKGAAWSFMANRSWGIYLLAGISFIASIIMIIMIVKTPNVKLKAALSFICAGALGNLVDRVLYKGVTDFIDLHFGSYIFPTFNIADSLVVCGTIFLAIVLLTDPSILANTPKAVLPVESAKSEQNEEKTIEN